jgi:CubicO group peptidase (beta-lactamase class C family)
LPSSSRPLCPPDFRRRIEGDSEHAVYAFRVSARDVARFGLLYLHRGKWRDRQPDDPGPRIGSSEWDALVAEVLNARLK